MTKHDNIKIIDFSKDLWSNHPKNTHTHTHTYVHTRMYHSVGLKNDLGPSQGIKLELNTLCDTWTFKDLPTP